MSGILVTCFKNYEAKCASDIYFLLSKVQDSFDLEAEDKEKDPADAVETTFDKQLSEEVAELKDRKQKSFISIDPCGLQCVLFLKANEGVDALKTTERLFELIEKRTIKSVRFCQRILPIQKVCMSNIQDITSLAKTMIDEIFGASEEPIDYCVVYDSRLNGTLDRMTVIDLLAELVGPKHKVNLSNPTKVILVQVMKSFCGISIVSNWVQHRKFNAQELLKKAIADSEKTE